MGVVEVVVVVVAVVAVVVLYFSFSLLSSFYVLKQSF